MEEGYEHSEENDFADMDEWLCEYVDGTIDPVVREALEEYMQSNPALASHVERLRETRHLLCRFGCRHKAPSQLQPRLRYQLANEIIRDAEPLLTRYNIHLTAVAAISSLAAILLIIATTTGTSFEFTSMDTRSVQNPASQNVQLPVWQASPVEQLQSLPIHARFTDQIQTSIVPSELSFSTAGHADTTSYSFIAPKYTAP